MARILVVVLCVFATSCTRQKGADNGALPNGCSENDRKEHIHKNSAAFVAQLRKCGKSALGNGLKTAACLTEALPRLSHRCAACYGKMVECSADNCKMKCMADSASKACIECSAEHCESALSHCTGVSAEKLP